MANLAADQIRKAPQAGKIAAGLDRDREAISPFRAVDGLTTYPLLDPTRAPTHWQSLTTIDRSFDQGPANDSG